MSGGNLHSVSSEMVGRADAVGDRLAREVLSQTISLLSVWPGNIIDLLGPDVIIMGGGVASMPETVLFRCPAADFEKLREFASS